MDVCKCIVPLRHGGTLNSRRAASPLVSSPLRRTGIPTSNKICLKNVIQRLSRDQLHFSRPLQCNLWRTTLATYAGGHKETLSCQVIYSQFGLAIHQNDYQARRRFVEWAQNEIAVVPDFHKRILFSDEAHFWLNGYVNKQNCRIWSEAYPQVYVETPLHPEKLTVWCALWAGGILLQKR
ncbi:hypothetical protein TNCV_3153571 [Trichonephila clavipes]|nr:hypothetical protein TNCV_3153571 [Trichonephila clavipes]